MHACMPGIVAMYAHNLSNMSKCVFVISALGMQGQTDQCSGKSKKGGIRYYSSQGTKET